MNKYSCIFCNEEIIKSDLDPCSLIIESSIDRNKRERKEQEFYCHVKCFKKSIKKSDDIEIDDPDFPSKGEVEDEFLWLSEQKNNVEEYLVNQNVLFDKVDDEPSWILYPYVSLWKVFSQKYIGKTGWWVISGDLPTDYLSNKNVVDARDAMRKIIHRWKDAAVYMLKGEQHPDFIIGNDSNVKELGELLKRRSTLLEEIVNNDKNW